MTDKTAIEKAKDALEAVNRIVDVLCLLDTQGVEEGSIADKVKQALAAIEAEKPSEDWRILCDVRIDMMRDCSYGKYQVAEERLLHFAESYHAEQCKACKK